MINLSLHEKAYRQYGHTAQSSQLIICADCLATAPKGSGHKPIRQEGQRTTFLPARLMPVALGQGASAFLIVMLK
ncbi:hypothetical protein [Bacillus sp. OK048]|uniref:hypothetical protein n=1 Tax=Bacillus sp. OK048 TaxID=1882761 RepID=UPI001113D986|nr:hypothetical protein [Bacillus sp. OK048]